MNLKFQKKDDWFDEKHKKYLAIYIALAIVLALNHIVFSYLLVDRERARALTASLMADLFTPLASSSISAGSNNVLVAEFIEPDAWLDDRVLGACSWRFPTLADPNPCLTLIDADGGATGGVGTDDDGAKIFYMDLLPRGVGTSGANIFFTAGPTGDNLCTDSISAPTCIYIDKTDGVSCIDGATLDNYLIGVGCALATDTLVGLQKPVWGHSELVSYNGVYDYYGSSFTWENSGLCGGTIGPWEPATEPLWHEVDNNGAYTPGVDLVYLDANNCLSTGPCKNGCPGVGPVGPGLPFIYDGGGACAGTPGDVIWQNPEPIWDDKSSMDGLYTIGVDTVIFDSTACLVGGETGALLNNPAHPPLPSAFTESIWQYNLIPDTVLAEGSGWNNNNPNQWQFWPFPNLVGGAGWNGNERFIDFDGDSKFGGITPWAQGLSGDEPVILDLDGDNYYEDGPDTLIDADGTASTGIGIDNDAIPAGFTFEEIAISDNLCINNFGYGGAPIIVYVDGTGDCIPNNGGTDSLIRDDTLSGWPAIIAGYGAYPYTFFNADYVLRYADTLVANGKWDFGSGNGATESLWYEREGANQWHPNIEGSCPGCGGYFDADGTGSLTWGVDNDGLVRGSPLTSLNAADNVCFALSPLGLYSVEDIYIDQTDGAGPPWGDGIINGNGDCLPANDPACGGVLPCLHPNRVYDWGMSGPPDGLNQATTLDGTWASLAGTGAAYSDTLVANGIWDWGAGNGATETLWDEFFNFGTYTSSADTDVYSTGVLLLGGDTLSVGTGPGGQNLIYADADVSGGLSAADTILEDNGNILDGSVPNSKIDRQEDIMTAFTVKNVGTAQAGRDISGMALYYAGTNGICDNPVESVDDIFISNLTWDGAQWIYLNLAGTAASTNFRTCLAANISAAATPDTSIQIEIPELYDSDSDNAYDAGDEGIFFADMLNNGVWGSNYTLPYTLTIKGVPSYSGRSSDTNPPSVVNNLIIKADSFGTVTLTWQDPADSDLARITVDQSLQNQTTTSTVDKGVQVLTLTNLTVGAKYTFKLRAEDTNGNIGPAIIYAITIPATGEVEVTQPSMGELMPSPLLEVFLPSGLAVGDLVKSATAPAVYYLGADNKKHSFPNELVYRTWYDNFSTVKIISDATLSSILTGKDVYIREGTYLVKKSAEAKVYAIEPNAVLRWIESEAIAKSLYGSRWTDRLVDLSDAMFNQYTVGNSIASNVHPTASLISYSGSTKIYYIENGVKREVSTAVFATSRFQDRFVAKGIATSISYTADSVMTAKTDVGYFQ